MCYTSALFVIGSREKLSMKKDIHPKYKDVKVTCSCGNTFTTRSTLEKGELHLEVCSNCHPFYTGKQKLVDTAGRVDRFKKKYSEESLAQKQATKKLQEEKSIKAQEVTKKEVLKAKKPTAKAVKKEAKK